MQNQNPNHNHNFQNANAHTNTNAHYTHALHASMSARLERQRRQKQEQKQKPEQEPECNSIVSEGFQVLELSPEWIALCESLATRAHKRSYAYDARGGRVVHEVPVKYKRIVAQVVAAISASARSSTCPPVVGRNLCTATMTSRTRSSRLPSRASGRCLQTRVQPRSHLEPHARVWRNAHVEADLREREKSAVTPGAPALVFHGGGPNPLDCDDTRMFSCFPTPRSRPNKFKTQNARDRNAIRCTFLHEIA